MAIFAAVSGLAILFLIPASSAAPKGVGKVLDLMIVGWAGLLVVFAYGVVSSSEWWGLVWAVRVWTAGLALVGCRFSSEWSSEEWVRVGGFFLIGLVFQYIYRAFALG